MSASDGNAIKAATLMRIFEIGERIAGYDLDEVELEDLGNELMSISGVCPSCRGSGVDGENPHPILGGGGEEVCGACLGHGRVGFDEKDDEG